MLVYKITNKLNNKCYIGSTNNFKRRKKEHIQSAFNPNSISYNYPLQKAFRKYGVDAFSFEVVEDNIDTDVVSEREKYYIVLFNSLVNTGHGYNQTLDTDCALRDPEIIQKNIESTARKCAEIDKSEKILATYASLHEAARALGETDACNIRNVCIGKMFSIKGHIFRFIDKNNNIIPSINQTNERRKSICGISIYNKDDVVYYESISEASRCENVERKSLQLCIQGSTKYKHVKERIWREYRNNEIIINSIDIDSILFEYCGYCSINYLTDEVIIATSPKELAAKMNISSVTVFRNLKENRIIKNIGYYKLDLNGNPIIKKEGDAQWVDKKYS